MKKDRTIAEEHKANFDTLVKAVKSGRAALMDCKLKATGESVAVVAGNPYELLQPPNPAGGYHED